MPATSCPSHVHHQKKLHPKAKPNFLGFRVLKFFIWVDCKIFKFHAVSCASIINTCHVNLLY